MCDSIEEGGTRCAAHTRPSFSRVVAALANTSPERRAEVRMGGQSDEETNTQAVTAHASTPSGREDVAELVDDLEDSDPDTTDWLRQCLKDGAVRAEAARAVKAQVTQKALTSAMRRIGVTRNPWITPTHQHRRILLAAVEKENRARFAGFKQIAEADKTLRAPDGWIEEFRASGTHTAAVPTDRVTAYALWRTQTTGSDFAPVDYDPDQCTRLVTGPDGWRPGDVIDEPGFREHGNVAHEGKTVAEIEWNTHAQVRRASRVTFTDGTVANARDLGTVYTVYRPISPQEADALRRYNEVNDRANHRGHIPGQGWYAVDPDTGARVFDPWGV